MSEELVEKDVPMVEENAPMESFVWRYTGKDLLDESIFGIVFLAIAIIACMVTEGAVRYVLLGLLGIPTLIYWCWLSYLFFIRRVCTSYELTPQNFIYRHGFLVQKTRFIELFDIEQVNIKRNLWERIIGVGTVQLRLKDQGTASAIEDLNIPGMSDFENMQKQINDYRTYYRTRVGRTLVRG